MFFSIAQTQVLFSGHVIINILLPPVVLITLWQKQVTHLGRPWNYSFFRKDLIITSHLNRLRLQVMSRCHWRLGCELTDSSEDYLCSVIDIQTPLFPNAVFRLVDSAKCQCWCTVHVQRVQLSLQNPLRSDAPLSRRGLSGTLLESVLFMPLCSSSSSPHLRGESAASHCSHLHSS